MSMAKGIMRILKEVSRQVEADISAYAQQGRIAGALSREGYNGGYLDALYDVMLALNGVNPNRNHWWWQARRKIEEKP
jgi:hypothetical protein